MIIRTLIVPTVPLKERTTRAFRTAHYGMLAALVLAAAVVVTDMYDALSFRESKRRTYLNSEATTFRRDWDDIQRTDVGDKEAQLIKARIEEINRVRRSHAISAGPILRAVEAAIEPGVLLERLTIDVRGPAINIELGGAASRVDALGMTVQKLGQVGEAGGIIVRGLRERGDGLVVFGAGGAYRRFVEAPVAPPPRPPRPPPRAPVEEDQ